MKRREFIQKSGQTAAGLSLLGLLSSCNLVTTKKPNSTPKDASKLFFKISLAQWSLHKAMLSGEMTTLDFAKQSRIHGCEGLEYVSALFKNKAKDSSFLTELNNLAKNEGQQNLLLMIDGEGELAQPNHKSRMTSIENHYKWVEAANFMGCHSIRVNLGGGKNMEEAAKHGIDSLNKLASFAQGSNVNILVENHGGFSSDGKWMQQIFENVSMKNIGTLPDFGNFCIAKNDQNSCLKEYDKYKGVKELMPFAKAVSAKSYGFNAEGEESQIDYRKMLTLVKEANYSGFIGIEFEGDQVSESKGIELTRNLLINIGNELS
ncbi:sugar phosphate isomerase/epimerase [Flavobacteriaceae bacterium]|nr:sugar phosphate isomerase/epimerase [Flavobacteriaceae bacterium]